MPLSCQTYYLKCIDSQIQGKTLEIIRETSTPKKRQGGIR